MPAWAHLQLWACREKGSTRTFSERYEDFAEEVIISLPAIVDVVSLQVVHVVHGVVILVAQLYTDAINDSAGKLREQVRTILILLLGGHKHI